MGGLLFCRPNAPTRTGRARAVYQGHALPRSSASESRPRASPTQRDRRWTLGCGSVAGDEYLRDMKAARLCDDGTARWIEICFCPTPLLEGLTGKSTLSSRGFKMPTTGAAAAIAMARSPGPVSAATAPSAWNKGSRRRASPFSGLSAWTQMRRDPDRRAPIVSGRDAMIPNKGTSRQGAWVRRARPTSGEDKRGELALYLRAAFIHFRNRDLTFRRALNRVRREGADAWLGVADAATKANERRMAEAIESINPFRSREDESRESRRLESELAVAENSEGNELARYLCAAFHACNSRDWGFNRILVTVGEDADAAWRSVAELAWAAEARQTTIQ
jgi:hypothetical protein